MACDTRPFTPNQTLAERKLQVSEVVAKVVKDLATGRIKPKVGPQGAIAFEGLTDADRAGVTDPCIYRRVIAAASPTALLAIQRAEALAGRRVDKSAVAIGAHSHDGGRTWHDHRG